MTTQLSRHTRHSALIIKGSSMKIRALATFSTFALLGSHLTACAPEDGEQPLEITGMANSALDVNDDVHNASDDAINEEVITLTDLESEMRGARQARADRPSSRPPRSPMFDESEPQRADEPTEVEPEAEPEPRPEPEADSESETETETELSYEHPSVSGALELPATPHVYRALELPPQFAIEAARADNTPADQAIDDDQATLGRVLFYDPLLSRNESTSCASCHQQELGFSDDLVLSEGFDGELTGRNSMPIINVRYYQSGAMFWDERAETLEHQVLMPIQDEVEMGLDLDALTLRLQETSYYPTLFTLAFGDDEITADRISRALAQFSRSIISYSSPYDLALAQSGGDPRPPFPQFSAQENRGKQLFFAPPQAGGAGCAGCHNAQGGAPRPGQMPTASIFFMNGALNNGLTDGRGPDEDLGLGAVTGRAADNGKFKSPTLRQIELTGPYMHDGSLETLRDVIDHYDSGVEPHPNLDPRLRQGPNGPPRVLGLSEADKVALEAFLLTLTDESIATDERFSDPFVQ